MLHTLAGAVAATGLEASTILAAIRKGQITANQDLFGEWHLEDYELQRLKSGEDCSSSSTASTPIKLEAEAGALIQQTRPDLQRHYCGPGDRLDRSDSSRGSRQLVVARSPLQQGSTILAEMAPTSADDICLDARDRVATSISPTCAYLQCAHPASILPGEKRKSELTRTLGGWGTPSSQDWVRRKIGSLPQTIDEAGLFCVCESRLSHRSPIFSSDPIGGESPHPQSHVARHAAGCQRQ